MLKKDAAGNNVAYCRGINCGMKGYFDILGLGGDVAWRANNVAPTHRHAHAASIPKKFIKLGIVCTQLYDFLILLTPFVCGVSHWSFYFPCDV